MPQVTAAIAPATWRRCASCGGRTCRVRRRAYERLLLLWKAYRCGCCGRRFLARRR